MNVGMHFKFNFRGCKIVKINNTSFEYVFTNPALEDGRTKHITFDYWKQNAFVVNGSTILRGDKVPVKLQNGYCEREIKRLRMAISVLLFTKQKYAV